MCRDGKDNYLQLLLPSDQIKIVDKENMQGGARVIGEGGDSFLLEIGCKIYELNKLRPL